MSTHPRRLIVGITGASGAIYGVRLLRLLQATEIETHLVMSRSAKITLTQEMDIGIAEQAELMNETAGPPTQGSTLGVTTSLA